MLIGNNQLYPCPHDHYQGACLACYAGSTAGNGYGYNQYQWTGGQGQSGSLRVLYEPAEPPVVERTPDPNIAAMYDADSGDA